MARKGKEIQLQRSVETQEDWEDMLSKEGLCVIDAYQDWCGPAAGMVGTFRKIKNELGDDLLKFICAKCDTIDALEKYRARCEPCFLFYAGGVLVAVIRGANAPLILRTITEQLAQEHKVLDGQAERKEIKDTMIAKLEEADKQKEEEEEAEEEPKKEVSVVIIKPDAVQSGKADDIMAEMKSRGIEILRQEERLLTDEEVKNVYIHLQDESYFDDLVTFMTSSPSIVLAITKGKTGQNVIQEFRDLIGPTEVDEAKEQAPESLRAKFGSDKYMNAVHGSDSQDTAARELAFFFPDFVAPTVEGKPKLQRTLALIRPDAYKNNKDEILEKIRASGFKVAMQKEIHLTKEQAEDFYSEHRGQDYFDELTNRMSSGSLLALGLAREEAITGWRQLLGPTKVDEAKEQEPDSLRAQFAEEGANINMLHGSDSEQSAQKEIEYFFPMEQTLAVIKPDAYGTKDEIVEKIHEAGFRIAARKETTLSKEIAEEFYSDHKDKEYYNELVEHMCSGPTYFMVLSREGAVDGWRSLIGPTDPSQAKDSDPDTLRGMFGQDTLRNAVHGSSTKDHALQNIEKIFGDISFNKDGTVKEDSEEVIAEQQQVSYETAPENGGTQEKKPKEEPKPVPKEEMKPKEEPKPEPKEDKPQSPKPEEKTEDGEETPETAQQSEQVDQSGDQTTEEPAQQQQQEEQKPADQEPDAAPKSEAQEVKQEEEAQPAPEFVPEPEKTEQTEEKPKTPEAEPKEPETTEQKQETSEETEQKPADEPEKPAEQQEAQPEAQPEAEQKEEAKPEEPKQDETPKAEEEPKADEAQAETTEEKKPESEQKEEAKTEEQKPAEGEQQQQQSA